MSVKSVKPVSFKKFIQTVRIPQVFEVQDGCYGSVLGVSSRDFSKGEIFRAESIDHVVNVTFSDTYSISSQKGLITLPLEFKGLFSPVVGTDKTLKTIKSIVSDCDFPCTAYCHEDIKVSGRHTTLPKGTRVDFIKSTTFTGHDNVYVLGTYYSTATSPKNILIGIETNGYFDVSKKHYTLRELLPRMPIQVFQVTNTSFTESQFIPGLPDNFNDSLFLSKIDVINCRPVVDTATVIRIPIETDFTVTQIVLPDDHFNTTKNIHDIVKRETHYPICVEVVDFDDSLKISGIMRDLQTEQLLIVDGVDEVEKVLTMGTERYFTIPTETYKGSFKVVPKICQTADEMWQNHSGKKLRVTENYIVSNSDIDSIYIGDILVPKEMGIVSFEREECEVIICSRQSDVPGRSKTVNVPSYAVGGFEEIDCTDETFNLSRLPCELPFRARLHSTPQRRKHNEDDVILRDEGCLKLEMSYSETDIFVSIFDESKNTTTHRFFIPEHTLVRVKKRNLPLGYRQGMSSATHERLMVDVMSESDFKSMCLTHQAYAEPTQLPPPIPPRLDIVKKRQPQSSRNSSSSDSDNNYDKPDLGKIVRPSDHPVGYVVPKSRHSNKFSLGLNTLKKKFNKKKKKPPVDETGQGYYESIDSDEDAHDYLDPIPVSKVVPNLEVERLEHLLADLDVSPDVLEKVHELKLTERQFIRQLKTASDEELMQRLKLKRLEIIALKGIFT
ncbi:uncharacterized protein [Antedon mediterranea]|uniref:uncharacterized protein n=1 Tax=Antedon mediterranea TaxID=105859 RepID=UPI003AF7A964